MKPSNPFATRFVKPGAIPFLFEEPEGLPRLLEKLTALGGRGAIVGPHGSGKSTLLDSLCRELSAAGWSILRVRVHPESLPTIDYEAWSGQTLLVVDGFERLSWWTRLRLVGTARLFGKRLLVTSHRPAGLPTLYQTQPRLATFERIVAELLPPGDTTLPPTEIEAAFAYHRGNLREALFELYDRYAQHERVG